MPDTATIVAAMLANVGITPDADEIDLLVEGYPAQRASADLLFAVDGLADIGPVTAFSLTSYA